MARRVYITGASLLLTLASHGRELRYDEHVECFHRAGLANQEVVLGPLRGLLLATRAALTFQSTETRYQTRVNFPRKNVLNNKNVVQPFASCSSTPHRLHHASTLAASHAKQRLRHRVPRLSLVRVPGTPEVPLAVATVAAFVLKDSRIGEALTPQMLAFSFAAILANIGLLPEAHGLYGLCSAIALPLSVAMGLLATAASMVGDYSNNSRGQRVASDIGRAMLLAFSIGAVGSVAGALLAHNLCTRNGLLSLQASAHAAGLMSATYVGGSVNFFAVAGATRVAKYFPSLLPSLLAADLALMGGYLLSIAAAARSKLMLLAYPPDGISPSDRSTIAGPAAPINVYSACPASPLDLAVSIGFAMICCAVATVFEYLCKLPGSGTVILSCLASLGGALLSQHAPKLSVRIASPLQKMSLVCGCVFLASLGASARLANLLVAGPAAVVFSAIVLLVHLCVILGGCALANLCGARIDAQAMLVASNANVGGAGTAVALASALGRANLVAPAALCGTLGYALATPLGVALHAMLSR